MTKHDYSRLLSEGKHRLENRKSIKQIHETITLANINFSVKTNQQF